MQRAAGEESKLMRPGVKLVTRWCGEELSRDLKVCAILKIFPKCVQAQV